VNKLLTWRNVRLTITVYVPFMIMLIELKKVLSQKLSCLCSKTTTDLSE